MRKTSTFVKTMMAALLVLSFGAAGCASSGQQFDTTHVSDIQTGVQDQAQILAWFGQPLKQQTVTGSAKGCIKRMIWVYAHSVAGGSTTAHSLVVDFNAAGKVCDHAYVKQRK